MANSLQDQYDPDQAIHRQMIGFSELIKRNLGETIRTDTTRTINELPVPFRVRPSDAVRASHESHHLTAALSRR